MPGALGAKAGLRRHESPASQGCDGSRARRRAAARSGPLPELALPLQAATRQRRVIPDCRRVCGAARQVGPCARPPSTCRWLPVSTHAIDNPANPGPPLGHAGTGCTPQARCPAIVFIVPPTRRYPWMASLRYNDGSGDLRCGGALPGLLCSCTHAQPSQVCQLGALRLVPERVCPRRPGQHRARSSACAHAVQAA